MNKDAVIARCPACATAFRVSEVQIAARDGQVRCGRCANVFDARAHLVVPAESPAIPEPPTTPTEPSFKIEAREHALNEAMTPETESFILAPAPIGDLLKPEDDRPRFENMAAIEAVAPSLELDFGRKVRTAAPTISPWIGWPGLAVLVLLLAAQIVFHLRGDIALLFPDIKPYAEELCIAIGCDLPLPRKPEMMSIESSDLQADTSNPGVMVLSATLRNRAPFAQTPPALELTLTDLQDQPVARRVLSTAQYIARGTAVGTVEGNRFPASTEVPVRVYFEAPSVKATGYRLYLFYP